jgi:hypothetical protein
MLNGRLYRASFAPFLIVLVVVAFSLTPRPGPLTSTLAPDAFAGNQAYGELRQLAAEFPNRRPGSSGDQRLALHVAHTIEGLGGTANGGFRVRITHVRAQTIEGERTLETVIAQRPGASGASPIVIIAHRDAVASGSIAQLSGTAALLELARVFASRETQRPIVLVSTSGGSGGDAGARQFAAQATAIVHGPIDAAIVLGDVASVRTNPPVVIPYSDGYGSAPDELQRTVAGALLAEAGVQPGGPSALGQLAHLAFGFVPGEQGTLDAAGVPAVLVQLSGEVAPSPSAAVSAERLEGVGRATVSAVDALDPAPAIEAEPQTGIVLAKQIIPAWALCLLIGALLLPPLVVLVDALARARRTGQPTARWVGWTLTCALPFFVCALFALALSAAAVLPATPAMPVLPGALPFGLAMASAVLACALVLSLAWLAWPALVRRLGLGVLPGTDSGRGSAAGAVGVRVGAGLGARVGSVEPAPTSTARPGEAAGVAALLVALVVAIGVWIVNPCAALLMVPGLHLLLCVASPQWRPRPLLGLGLVALSLLPLMLLIAFYAHQLGYGPGGLAEAALLLVAGGQLGLVALALWSIALGCAAAMALIAVTPRPDAVALGPRERTQVTIRGPLSYAGPGSLGGTESALPR